MSKANYTVRGATAVITLDNLPVNGLGHALRAGIVAGIQRAAVDSRVEAVVLIGSQRVFSGGADIRELGTANGAAPPHLLEVITAIESSDKPVIAAIGGVCMGGGLELALGCHFRVVIVGAQIALPEVKLGLLPGAGGTQRLPRVIGVKTALNMIVFGTTVTSEDLRSTQLFDEFVEGDLLEGALAFADRVIAEKRPLKLVRDITIQDPGSEEYFQTARKKLEVASGALPAPLKCLEAVEAAVKMSFEEGMNVESSAFMQLIHSPESRALRHAFRGERAAAKIADVSEDAPTRKIEKVGIIGAGTMGTGIAMTFVNVGIPVVLLEMKPEALERGLTVIRKSYESSIKKGRLSQAQVDQRMGLITATLAYEDVSGCDLIVEAVFEEMGVKEQVFRKLDQIARTSAILASNTSTLNIDTIAGFTKRPQDVLGMHFFSPANVMRLLEVVRGRETAKDALASVMKVAKIVKKIAVVSGVCEGFIGNRLLRQYVREATNLVEEGATPQQVDRALEQWGMAMGPYRMNDLAGNDVSWRIRKRLYAESSETRRQPIADRLCELGRYGQKVGKGWYLYQPGQREPIVDPEVDQMIRECRQSMGITPRQVSTEEVVQRCIFALVNEGSRILAEGIAARASDIDIVYLTGYGFPAYRGGPMFYADEVGLDNVVRTMKRFAAGGNAFWEPAPLLARLAAEGRTFNESISATRSLSEPGSVSESSVA